MRKVGYVLSLLTLVTCLAVGKTKTYTIREGDTVSGIAAKLSVRQADLLRANSLSSTSTLKIGRKLTIPRSATHRAASVSGPPQSGAGYTVRQGDNDWTIARRFSLTEHQLHLMNPGVHWNRLQPGLHLDVTSGHAGARKAVAHNTRHASSPARPSSSGRAYTVKPDDNDWLISSHLGVTVHKLHELNPNVNWDRLQIGTKLAIPGSAAVAARTSTIRSRYAKIARDSVVIRRKPSTESDKVTTVPAGLLVMVLDRHAGWYQLKFPKGTVGWVRGDMLKAAKRPLVARRIRRARHSSEGGRRYAHRGRHHATEIAMATPAKAPSVIKKAFSKLGARYTWARNDCSGYVMGVMRSQGVSLPHSSRGMSRFGRQVSKDDLKPGDLVFFHTGRSKKINHVGIALGRGRFIHSSSGGGKVQVNSLSEGYYRGRFATARRVLSQSSKHSKKHKKKA